MSAGKLHPLRPGAPPPGYDDTLSVFAALVTAEKPVAATLREEGLEPAQLATIIAEDTRLSAAERLDVYAHMYFYRIHDVLWEYLPRTAALLGDDAFWNLLTVYLQRHPSRHPSLRYVGQDLETFVRETPAWTETHPWLADLIALEWTRIDLVDRRDADVLTWEMAQAWSAGDLAAMPLRMVPAAQAFDVRFAVDELWRAEETDDPLADSVRESPRTLLVWRRELDIHHRVAEPDEARWFGLLREGTSFGELCEKLAGESGALDAAAARAFALVSPWIGEGLLVAAAPSDA